MKKFGLLFFLLVIVSSLFLSACGSDSKPAAGSSSDNEPKVKVRMGYFPNLDHAPALVGVKKGIYAEELSSAELETQVFPDGNAFMDSLNSGNLDFGYVGPGPAINRFLQGNDVVILASAANGATLIVSRADSGITSIKDLAGKSFCSPGIGCTHNVQLEKMMADLGLKSNRIGGDVVHQKHNPAHVQGLFESKQMDAAALPEPWGTYLVETTGANVIAEWDEVAWGTTLPSVVFVSRKSFIEEHPEVIRQAMKAHLRSIEYVKENKDESIKLINEMIYELTQKKMPDEVLAKSWDRMVFTPEVHKDALQEWANASYELKFINQEPKLDGLVDTTLMEETSKL